MADKKSSCGCGCRSTEKSDTKALQNAKKTKTKPNK